MKSRIALVVACIVLGMAALVALGRVWPPTTARDIAYQTTSPSPPMGAAESLAGVAGGAAGVSPEAQRDASVESYGAAPASEKSEPLVIRSAQLSVRVKDVDSAVRAAKAAVLAAGGTVQSLTLGDSYPTEPVPYATRSDELPRSASVTLRVPAAKLDTLVERLSALGAVTSQSAAAEDVTVQHVDLAARLKNLQAEEARLRSFFDQAKTVSDMLAIESELSRVRGEIEALQAQIDYLERQAAQATLVVELSEPGAVVRPEGVDWGFGDAITGGIQSAVALLRGAITALIALSPVLFAGLAVWGALRFMRRRRNRRDQQTLLDDEAHQAPAGTDVTQE